MRRIPLQLQEAVEAEIDKLLKEGHIRRVETLSDEVFIQLVVMTVKKDKTDKIALDARSMMPSILIVTKGTKQQYMEKVEEVLTILDEAGIRLKLEKCKIAKTKTKWLGFKLSERGVKTIDETKP